ncbi:hypothetical protein EOL73_00555 [Candidatus Saccharibacteria bacterium]|nr:hypothetical protein [Candidatus Saccharibacteria bacterium]NCU40233.1 hypothetical protein [Candidatus Saccharibacteria bacterium]
MGLFLRQTEDRSELQTKIATELQEKLRASSIEESDPVEPQLLANQHNTRTAGVIITFLVFILIVVAIIAVSKL